MSEKSFITAEELFNMGDIGICELVKGEIIHMSPAGGKHGTIASRIDYLLRGYVEAHQLGTVCAAETGFLIKHNPDTVRAPDVAFVAKERIPQQSRSAHAPRKRYAFWRRCASWLCNISSGHFCLAGEKMASPLLPAQRWEKCNLDFRSLRDFGSLDFLILRFDATPCRCQFAVRRNSQQLAYDAAGHNLFNLALS